MYCKSVHVCWYVDVMWHILASCALWHIDLLITMFVHGNIYFYLNVLYIQVLCQYECDWSEPNSGSVSKTRSSWGTLSWLVLYYFYYWYYYWLGHQSYWLGGRKGIRPKKTWGVVEMGSPLVLAGVASTGTVGALRLHYPPLAPQKSRRNNGGL